MSNRTVTVPAEWFVRVGWTWRDAWPPFRRTRTGFVLFGRWRRRRSHRATLWSPSAPTGDA